MESDKYLLRLMLVTGLISISFIPGLFLQYIYSWYPKEALSDGTIHLWVLNIQNFKFAILLGIGFSIISIISFSVLSFLIYKSLPQKRWESHLGRGLLAIGLPLALVAYVSVFGYTWALADLGEAVATEPGNVLSQVAASLMRGFLISDDLASHLIGLGVLFLSFEAYSAGFIPKWLKWWGIIAGVLLAIALFRYFIPMTGLAMVGYPLLVMWFVLTGVFFYIKGMKMQPNE